MNPTFSRWPGAWERHLIRRHDNPQYFINTTPPTNLDIADAQTRDQHELVQFNKSLESLIHRSMHLTEDACSDSITSVKKELDICQNTAFGLAADLTEQKVAIASLNEIITSAMQRSLPVGDGEMRLSTMVRNEEIRKQRLHLLEYPIVSDLLRSVCPVPPDELPAALLSESDSAYEAALEIFDEDRKTYLAHRLDILISTLESEKHKLRARKKLELLHKQLPDLPAINTSIVEPESV